MGATNKMPPLPAGYTQLEWFTTKGATNSFIDLLVTGKTTRRYEIDAQVVSNVSSVNTAIMSAVRNSKYFQIVTNSSDSSFMFQAGSPNSAKPSTKDTNRHLFILDALHGRCRVDNNQWTSMDVGTEVTIDLYCGLRNGDNARASVVKFYSLKVYEDNLLIRHFVPCYEIETGKNKLYDFVSGNAFDSNNNVDRGPEV